MAQIYKERKTEQAAQSVEKSEQQVPTAKNWTKHLWWQLLLFAAVTFACSNSSEQLDEGLNSYVPETVVNCSTYNKQSSGYKAFYELANRCGFKTIRFETGYRELKKQKGVMIVAAPNNLMSEFDLDRVLKWVEQGNNLVFLDYCLYGNGAQIAQKLGVKAVSTKVLENWVCNKIPDSSEMQHVHRLVFSSETRLKGGNEIIKEDNSALITEVKRGDGHCLLITSPGFCSNRRISDQSNWGNFQFLLNWCQSHGGTIIFDERVHGHSVSQSVFVHIMKGPWAPVILQIILIFMLALLSLNQRFGVPVIQLVKRKIASREFIEGMSLTYRKARAYDAAWSILFGSFRTRLCRALALPPHEKPEVLAQAWAQAAHIDEKQALHLLKSAEGFEKTSIRSEEELLANIKECDLLYEKSKSYLSVQRARRLGG